MSARNLAGYLLLLFAAVSAVVLIVRESGGGRGGVRSPSSGSAATTRPTAGKLTIYYFHSNERCPECERMEILSREAVEGGFADAMNSGRLDFLVENWEAPENQSLCKSLGVAFPGLVVVWMREGKIVAHKLLEDARPLLNDREKFTRYVRTEVGAALGRF